MKRQRKSGLEQALDDVEAGRVYEAKSVEDLMVQLDAWSTPFIIPNGSRSRTNSASVVDLI